jgi:RND family efflux transporter MFP subunit
MNYRAGLLTGIVVTAAAAALLVLAWAAFSPKAAKSEAAKTPPATVLKEEDLLTVTLTEKAHERLKLEIGTVKESHLRRARTFGGDVTIPPGHTILVAAPLNGTLKAPSTGVPRAGSMVKKGDAVFQLLPLLSPDARTTFAAARAEADGQVNTARINVRAAQTNLDRAKSLLRTEGGSQRDVDNMQALFDVAVKTLEATQARLALLTQAVGDAEKGTAAPLAIEAPTDGLLRTVSALSEQNVPSGAALFEVVNLDPVWIRVPIFVGETDELMAEEASIGSLAIRPEGTLQKARSVAAPPSANPLTGTVDMFFTLPNTDRKLIPGQRVGVQIGLKDFAKDLTVPWSAVIVDINGGTWVYTHTPPHTFIRRRVQVRYVQDGIAVLKSGPSKDTPVVVVGAQELFGTEVGNAK